MNAYIMVRLPTGTYKNVDVNNIEQVFINRLGEKTVFFYGEQGLEYGIEVEVKQE